MLVIIDMPVLIVARLDLTGTVACNKVCTMASRFSREKGVSYGVQRREGAVIDTTTAFLRREKGGEHGSINTWL